MDKPNTRIDYMYRDAANYKKRSSVVFKGKISRELLTILRENMSEEEYFIPSQVGLEDLQHYMESFPDEDDGVWHELEDISLTDKESTDPRTIEEFAAAVKGVVWDVELASKNLGISLS